MHMITSNDELSAILPILSAAPALAIDTEFMREKTYFPQLCLLQIAASATDVFLIDTLVPGLDLKLLAPVLADATVVKVFHAGAQDLQILYQEIGVATAPIFDTQDAAALLGYPEQIGYGALVQEALDVRLGKADSFTNWARRPLNDAQLLYAADDVIYLLRLYPRLVEQLTELGRETWLDDDFARKAAPAGLVADPRQQFRRLKRGNSLKARQLAIAREVAAWREEEAMRRNMPKRWLMGDETVVEIAKRAPQTIAALRDIRGVQAGNVSQLKDILAAVDLGVNCPPADWPAPKTRVKPDYDTTAALDLMGALVHKRAKENRLSSTQLAPRALLETLAATRSEDSPLLQGWRRAMIGEELLALLNGRLRLSLRHGNLEVEEV
jgi:ribonuclease D